MSPPLRRIFSLVLSLALVGSSALTLLPSLIPPAEATFVGYNGKIALRINLGGNRDVYTMNSDGSEIIRLTTPAGNDLNMRWSPDGTEIAFTSNRDGNQEIYIMDADGSNQTRLTNSSGEESAVIWSPDGTEIAFSYWNGSQLDLYVMNADGTGRIQLTNTVGNESNPQWSPDSTKIIFNSNQDGNNNVYVINVNGTNQSTLTNNAASDAGAKWSPDGTKIAFVSYRDGNGEIYIMNDNGSNQSRISHTSGFDEDYINWSPDGTKLAGVRFNAGGDASTLLIFNTSSWTEQEFDYSGSGIDIVDTIDWSPDGHKLAITAYDSSWSFLNQYVVNADGSSLTQLTNDGISGEGVWQSVPNTTPVTTSDTLGVQTNVSGLADVLANDTDEEDLPGSNLTVTIQPAHGSAATEAGKVKYTPTANYVGTDSLTYKVCDAFTLDQKCSTGVLGITVSAGPVPATPTITSVGTVQMHGATSVYYTGHRPTFTGTAAPGATVTVEIHSDPIILSTTADSSGHWSVTPSQDLPNGEHEVNITATKDGSTSAPLKLVLGINTGLAATGVPVWPLSLIGLASLFGLRRYLQRQVTAH